MTDKMKSFSDAAANVQNRGRGVAYNRGVAKVNFAAELFRRGIDVHNQDKDF